MKASRGAPLIERAGVVITHPEKVLFPDDGITKGDLAAYYEAIAPVMVPQLRGRPVTMERFPAGIGRKGFIQKDVSKGFPSWLERVEVPKKDGVVHHPVVTDARSLLWLANQNSITPHVWTSRLPDLYHPDICVFDLDPSIDSPEMLRNAALQLRDLLDELGLPSWIKTSGSKGYHIVVPLDGNTDTGNVAGFAHAIGTLLVTAAAGSWWTPGATATARRSRRPTRCAPGEGRPCRRRARGRKSRVARSIRSRSRSGRCRTGWRRWGICGRT